MRYARIVDNAIADFREFETAPDPNPVKGLDWRPCDPVARPSATATQVVEGPFHDIAADAVTERWTVRNKTAEEIDGEKEGTLDRYDRLSFEVNFDQENRIRVLEGRQAITRATYRNALKARL